MNYNNLCLLCQFPLTWIRLWPWRCLSPTQLLSTLQVSVWASRFANKHERNLDELVPFYIHFVIFTQHKMQTFKTMARACAALAHAQLLSIWRGNSTAGRTTASLPSPPSLSLWPCSRATCCPWACLNSPSTQPRMDTSLLGCFRPLSMTAWWVQRWAEGVQTFKSWDSLSALRHWQRC